MKTTASSTCLQNQLTLQILNNMDVNLTITENPNQFPVKKLFKMAARINKKRGFLFVSKVLGKHIPVNPLIPQLTSGLLAIEYYERKTGNKFENKQKIIEKFLSENTDEFEFAFSLLNKQKLPLATSPIIIGFAETATALGHAVFDYLENSFYISTTREEIMDFHPTLNFEEEHSHAVDQRCFIPKDQLESIEEVILVDDEITTGKTALNIIKEIHSNYPFRKEYSVLSILDWRSKENREEFKQVEQDLGINITVISLLAGEIEFRGEPLEDSTYDYQADYREKEISVKHINLSNYFTPLPYKSHINHAITYLKETGRFGLTHSEKMKLDDACLRAGKSLKEIRQGTKTLCLGTGELMYLPMKVATFIGKDVFYHATTRSPIHPVDRAGYGIKNGFKFINPEDDRITHYIYNIPKGYYDEVFLFFEGTPTEHSLQPLYEIFKDRGIASINIVTMTRAIEGSERHGS